MLKTARKKSAQKRKRRSIRSSNAPRLSRGRVREGASLPVPQARAGLPSDYASVLAEIKNRIQKERSKVVLAANTALVQLYWDIGRMILVRQATAGWGARVIDRLAVDLRDAYPDMHGFSPRNLLFMRGFAASYPDRAIVKQLVSQLPWGHVIRLIQRVKSPEARDWYARQAIRHGWSRSVLDMQIKTTAYKRSGKAQNNFKLTLPSTDSDHAVEVFKDPYLFDFLGTADPRREREVETALVDHIQRFLIELGTGFAFVGRQVHLEVGDDDFYIDLLFYHLKLRCYVVVEFKAVPFDPGFIGQLNMYLSAADDLLRHQDDKPTIGLLLCRSRNKVVVEYALRNLKRPIGVAEWETKIVEQLPRNLRGSLPSIEEIEAELESTGAE